MNTKIYLTGIYIGGRNCIICKYRDLFVRRDFRHYLDSDGLKPVEIINLWYEIDYEETIFFSVIPVKGARRWDVYNNRSFLFSIEHNENRNLLDEIEEEIELKRNWRIDATPRHGLLLSMGFEPALAQA